MSRLRSALALAVLIFAYGCAQSSAVFQRGGLSVQERVPDRTPKLNRSLANDQWLVLPMSDGGELVFDVWRFEGRNSTGNHAAASMVRNLLLDAWHNTLFRPEFRSMLSPDELALADRIRIDVALTQSLSAYAGGSIGDETISISQAYGMYVFEFSRMLAEAADPGLQVGGKTADEETRLELFRQKFVSLVVSELHAAEYSGDRFFSNGRWNWYTNTVFKPSPEILDRGWNLQRDLFSFVLLHEFCHHVKRMNGDLLGEEIEQLQQSESDWPRWAELSQEREAEADVCAANYLTGMGTDPAFARYASVVTLLPLEIGLQQRYAKHPSLRARFAELRRSRATAIESVRDSEPDANELESVRLFDEDLDRVFAEKRSKFSSREIDDYWSQFKKGRWPNCPFRGSRREDCANALP